jgi:diaminopimelate epimerase
MITFPYTKYSGCGNDFIFVDHRRPFFPLENRNLIETLCDRKKGIGADGIVFLETTPHADGKMRIFNRDGSEAEMCGNALRCMLPFMTEKGYSQPSLSIEVNHQLYTLEPHQGRVKSSMAPPSDMKLDLTIEGEGGPWEVHYINTGVPHLIVFCEEVEKAPLTTVGPYLRRHPAFAPAGVNVNFVQLQESSNSFKGSCSLALPGKTDDFEASCESFKIRTFERGVGETLACGTGATAAAIVIACKKKISPPFTAIPASGEPLEIGFVLHEERVSHLYQSGAVYKQFEGIIKV